MKQAELFKAIVELGELVKNALEAMARTKKKKGTRRDKAILKSIQEKIIRQELGIDVSCLSAPAVAKFFGFSDRQIFRHFESGAPRNPDKTIDLPEYSRWFRKFKDEEIKKAEASHGLDSVKERNSAEIDYKKSQAELHRLKIDMVRGGLVSKLAADERVKNILVALKKKLGELPGEASRLMGKDLVGTRKEMQEIVFEVLERLAREANKPLRRKKNDATGS